MQGNRRRGGPREDGKRDNIIEDIKEYQMTENVAENVCGMTKAGKLLHG